MMNPIGTSRATRDPGLDAGRYPSWRPRADARSGTEDGRVDAYLGHLATEALQHEAVQHRYLRDLAAGDLPDLGWALADFATQYAGYSAQFPRYLAAVIAKMTRPDHRRPLLTNLTGEKGHLDEEEIAAIEAQGIDPAWVVGVPHPELFRRFQAAIGAAPAEGDAGEHIEVECWRELFHATLVTGTPAEAVGALGLGTEQIVKHVYRPILAGIRRHGVLDRKDAVFFELHCEVDDAHSAALLGIARDFARDQDGRRQLRKGMRKALSLRSSFWGWLHGRALGGPGRVAQ